nr:glycosyltransferase [Alphaproteobacteria bacterium]
MPWFSFDNVKKRENFDDLTLKLSVIISCYNHEDTVARAMDSILAQKVNFEYEILVCDDCSSDRTQEILLSYKDKFKNIKFLFNKKRYGSKKYGGKFSIAMAGPQMKGQYWAILEGDDYYINETKFQQQIGVLDRNQALTACYSNLIIDNQISGKVRVAVSENIPSMIFDYQDWFQRVRGTQGTTAMFRNIFIDIWNGIGSFRRFSDITFQFLYFYHGDCGYINKPLSCYVYHGNGVWSGKNAFEQTYSMIERQFAFNQLSGGKFAIYYTKQAEKYIKAALSFWQKSEKKGMKRTINIMFLKMLRALNDMHIMLHEEKNPTKRWLLMEHDFNNKGISKDTRRNRLLLKILVRTQIDYIIVKPFWFLYTWL